MDTDKLAGAAVGLIGLALAVDIAHKVMHNKPLVKPMKPAKIPKCSKQKCLLKSKHTKIKW